jgi:hypothetical protein
VDVSLPRSVKQIGLVIVLACWLGSLCLLYTKAFATTSLGWAEALSGVGVLVPAGFVILWVILHTARLPTVGEVHEAVGEIRGAWAMGAESYKGRLHFCFPPRWRTWKLGKEGWLLRPKGLGAPVGFSIWAVARDPAFSDTSFEGMVKNVQDIVTRTGGRLDSPGAMARRIGGVEGITYWQRDLKGHETLGFFWYYEEGDYTFLVDASSRRHIEVIRPAIDEFVRHFEMR